MLMKISSHDASNTSAFSHNSLSPLKYSSVLSRISMIFLRKSSLGLAIADVQSMTVHRDAPHHFRACISGALFETGETLGDVRQYFDFFQE